ncbi:MAG: glycerol-3-phosphate dehydrogenase [Burkholderiaceae bacterium]
MDGTFDIAIIGGGVNGCGIARDAAGRGLSVYLCEQADLASGTSSAATKLIHGGLRYLEYFEFRLVREALIEREILWRMAPHIVRPLRFVLPHHKGLRPAWMLRLGLFLYDHLGGRKLLPATRALDLSTDVTGKPLKAGEYTRGFEYSDCWVDDARLVVLNARDAANRGAIIKTRTKAISAERGGDVWQLTTEDMRTGTRETIRAKILINAAGPWVGEVLAQTLRQTTSGGVRLVQGSHIIVPKLYEHDRCYIFQNADQRIIFVIPYEQDFTLIGTTDRDYVGDPADAKATPDEIAYLCSTASDYFANPIAPADVVWSYSGVRPLYDDGAAEAQAATRDYVLDLDDREGAALLSIYGGKITTYRRLAQHALQKLAAHLPEVTEAQRNWSGGAALPGGDFPVLGFEELCLELAKAYPWLEYDRLRRLARAYGTRARAVLGSARQVADLGFDFGAGLSEAEVSYLMREEWAQKVDDIIWRRSKLGLRLTAQQIGVLEEFVARRREELLEH